MLIPAPKLLPARDANSCAVLKQNDYFRLLLQRQRATLGLQGFTPSQENFLIALVKKDELYVVAEAKSAKDIEEDWKFLLMHLFKGSAPQAADSEEDRAEMIKFLEEKCVLLASHREEDNKITIARLNFHSLFPTIADFDYIIEYSCAKKTNGVKMEKGTLYLTHHYICFSSAADKLLLPFVDLTLLTSDVPDLAHPVRIVMSDLREFVLAFNSKDNIEMLNIAEALWDSALEGVIRKEEDLLRTMDSLFAITPTTPPDNIPIKAVGSPLARRRPQPQNFTVPRVKSVSELKNLKRNKKFHTVFRLPEFENLQGWWLNRIFVVGDSAELKGHIYLSTNFLCLAAAETYLQGVIPLIEILAINNDEKDKKLYIGTATKLIQISTDGIPDFPGELAILWKIFKMKCTLNPERLWKDYNMGDAKIDELVKMGHSGLLESSHRALEDRQTQKWKRFLDDNGQSTALFREATFEKLVRNGVPNNMRGILWQLMSGSLHLRLVLENESYFATLLKDNEARKAQVLEEIERDLHRSFPEHSHYQTGKGIPALRRVLHAYNWHNPSLGYCQAMNIVAAVLLLFMSEEAAFYMLQTIAEVHLPGAYTRAMIGATVDQIIFEQLLKQRLGFVSEHLSNYNVPLSAITMPWFITLFIGYLPMRAVLRIMDLFFIRGVEVLMQAGLAVIYICAPKILAEDDSYSIVTLLKDCKWIEVDELFRVMFEMYGDVTFGDVSKLRQKHRVHAIADLQSSNRHSIFTDMTDRTKFSRPEVEKIYDQFKKITIANASPFLDFAQFSELMRRNIKWFSKIGQDNQLRIFHSLRIPSANTPPNRVSFQELICSVYPWWQSDLRTLFHASAELFARQKDGRISAVELELALTLLMNIYQKNGANVEVFVKMLFDKLGEQVVSEKLALSDVESEILDKPLLNGFFGV